MDLDCCCAIVTFRVAFPADVCKKIWIAETLFLGSVSYSKVKQVIFNIVMNSFCSAAVVLLHVDILINHTPDTVSTVYTMLNPTTLQLTMNSHY